MIIPSTMTVLQSVLMPGLGFGAPEEMYLRPLNGDVRTSLKDRKLVLKDGGRASFDTFFNGLTIDAWRRESSIIDLHLLLRGSGKLAVRFGLHRIGHGHRWLDERIIELSAKGEAVELEFWPELDAGMLYFSIEAIGAATLSGGWFATTTPPVNDVSLGVVITHFDRKRYLLPAIQRLRDGLLNDPRYNVELVIVDNSRDVTAQEAGGATVLPNKNLGGSGGFMRGLLYLKDRGEASHCLFMDDDASCEVDSIKRTYALLQFSNTEKFTVAGSLLREIEPHRLFEKGSKFDGMCHPQKGGLDMRSVGDLLLAEQVGAKPDYGGWWFFAFAIADIEHYSFPFFIRGDDIQFAMTNKLDICTINGIASWAEDFGMKSGPMPIYFDVRSHLTQKFCVLSSGLPSAVRMISRFFFLSLFSYNYATAKAVTIAVRDVASGPKFWLDNLDMRSKRATISALAPSEKLQFVDKARLDVRHRGLQETRLRRFVRVITLNGFLLPSFLLRDAVMFQHKDFCGSLVCIFRYKKVLYEYEPLALGYVATHDKRRFFAELGGFLWQLSKFALRYQAIKREYLAAFGKMTSEAFWQGVYVNEPAVAQAPVSQTLQSEVA